MKKKKLTARERFLLIVLAIMAVCAIYLYGFQMPMQEKIAYYTNEATAIDDQLIMAEAKSIKMQKMEKELKEIIEEGNREFKEMPVYDNSVNVMSELSSILEKTQNYDVTFLGTIEQDGIIRRNISLSYVCQDYDSAKNVLLKIYDGKYRCLLKDLTIRQSEGKCHISVAVTYFEYK